MNLWLVAKEGANIKRFTQKLILGVSGLSLSVGVHI